MKSNINISESKDVKVGEVWCFLKEMYVYITRVVPEDEPSTLKAEGIVIHPIKDQPNDSLWGITSEALIQGQYKRIDFGKVTIEW